MKNITKEKLIRGVALSSAITLSLSATSAFSQTAQKVDGQKDSLRVGNNSGAHMKKAPSDTNVIYIVLDDMGFSDLGCYGAEIKTPNIDKLAKAGLRYNNFNATPVSSPTRASLLTGRNHNEVGMAYVSDISLEDDRPNVQGRLNPDSDTVMEVLKANGYSAYGLGKYHMTPGFTQTPAGPFDNWPLAEGYDRYYGFLDGETDQFDPQLVNGNELISAPNVPDYNLNDDLTAHAKQYIADHVSHFPNKPFFMNFSFGTAHSPLQAPKAFIDMYSGTYDKGWDKIREERFARQKELGIIPSDSKMLPRDASYKAWKNLSADEKKVFARFMEAYAGYVTQADEKVGELVSYLKKVGEYDNTMIVLISDNGATHVGGPNGTDSFFSTFEGRKPSIDYLMERYNLIGTGEMGALYPSAWAQVSNTPFKGYKFGIYNGGVRVPMIVSYPAGDFKDKGTVRNQYVDVSDVTATVYDMLGITPPEVYKGIKQRPVSGISFANTFKDANAAEARTSNAFFSNNWSSVYKDGWRAISKHKMGKSFGDDVWELYNVNKDYSQLTNVAADYPEKIEALKKVFLVEAQHMNILPLKELTRANKGYSRKESSQNNKTFKYYPEMEHANLLAGPAMYTAKALSYTVTAPIKRKSADDEGVLFAAGDNIGGYTLYIKDNKLVYEYNKHSDVQSVVSNVDVPTGASTVQYVYTSKARNKGIGELFINGKSVSNKVNIQKAYNLGFEGFDVGIDRMLPASSNYADEPNGFKFEGEIEYIQIDTAPLAVAK